MTLVGRITAIENRLLDRFRSRAAHRVATDHPTGDLESFRGRKYCLLVTYRKDGTPVPSPVWFAERDGNLYVHTAGWKVKRIATNPRVRIAPCTFRGRPLGPPVKATARAMSSPEEHKAEDVLGAKYGFIRRAYYRTLGSGQKELGRYVELTPDPPS